MSYKDGYSAYIDSSALEKIYNVKVKSYLNNEKMVTVYDSIIKTNVGENPRKTEKRGEGKDKERSMETSISRTKNAIYDYARSNVWEYFVTLTFDPKKVDRYDDGECTKKLSVWLMNIRRLYSRDLKYVVIPELHQDGAFHFHALFANVGNMDIVDSGHKTKDGQIKYNIGKYHLGWTEATKIKDTAKASNYVTKYITKELCAATFNKKRYWVSKNLDKPLIEKHYSNNIQMVKDSLENIAEYSKECDIKSINSKVTYYGISSIKQEENEQE